MRRFIVMSGRIVDRNSLADAKRTAEYIAHRNMLIGYALQNKLAEEKEDRKKHLRNDLRVVRKGDDNIE